MSESTDGSIESISFAIADGAYTVDPELSEVSLRAEAFGVKWVHGTMPVADGAITISENHLSGNGRLSADRIDTGLRPRDRHLRSSHYLQTAQHPTIAVNIDNMSLVTGYHSCEVTIKDVVSCSQVWLETVPCMNNELHVEATMTSR
ncbi:YceI family protein [Rhodococcus sp. 14C212]|nr:YceI family protein [Rhodococcus sp. 14C212]